LVPVGKDQLQHLEITRDVSRFNHKWGFCHSRSKNSRGQHAYPWNKWRKMSKSANNIINIFLDEALRKQMMSIETDKYAHQDPKNQDTCNAFAIYKLLATKSNWPNDYLIIWKLWLRSRKASLVRVANIQNRKKFNTFKQPRGDGCVIENRC
jgi:tryptophanyl-tRNA synthetase